MVNSYERKYTLNVILNYIFKMKLIIYILFDFLVILVHLVFQNTKLFSAKFRCDSVDMWIIKSLLFLRYFLQGNVPECPKEMRLGKD